MKKVERNEDAKKQRHWAVADVFENAISMGLAGQSWRAYSLAIKKTTGKEIPPGTLKYWYAGWSEPKTSELEAMAATVGLELELLQNTPIKDKANANRSI